WRPVAPTPPLPRERGREQNGVESKKRATGGPHPPLPRERGREQNGVEAMKRATGGPHPGPPPWNGGGSKSRAGPISANRVGPPSEPGERTGGSTQDQLATGLRGRARLRAMVMARITATTPSDHSTGIL